MRRTVLTGALALMMIGCLPPPKQAGGLRFFDHKGFEHRMRMLCRLGVGDNEIKTACAVPEMHRRLAAEAEKSDAEPVARDGSDAEEASKSCSGEENQGTLCP
ncbi:MAG: hypothetical protein JRI68_15195 [Deltaproteobacteria bacterium]|nr:hypothetical protein [Deltaproteobacteria bacterium]